MNKNIFRNIAIMVAVIAIPGCASPVRNEAYYYTKDIAVQNWEEMIEELNDVMIAIDDEFLYIMNRKFNYAIENGRVLKFSNNGVDNYISVFDDNCFKPRRARKFILSILRDDLIPYSRNVHNSKNLIKQSDNIVLDIIK